MLFRKFYNFFCQCVVRFGITFKKKFKTTNFELTKRQSKKTEKNHTWSNKKRTIARKCSGKFVLLKIKQKNVLIRTNKQLFT